MTRTEPRSAPESRTERGRRTEQLAAGWLQRRGYEVLDRNFRVWGGELDLVCRAGDVLVFVEVRSRTGDRFGHAVETIGHTKQLRMRHAARRWLDDRGAPASAYRFDLVALQLDPAGACRSVELVEDILG